MLPIPFSLLLAAATIHTNFEGGNLGREEVVSNQHLRLGLKGQTDQDGRNRQANWYYFRVEGVRVGQPFRIDLVDLPGEYNYKPNRGAVTKDTPPVISYDNETWRHVTDFEYDAAGPKVTLKITPNKSRFWIAHTPPYTLRHLNRLRAVAGKQPSFQEEVIGKSVRGRSIYLWTIGKGPKTAWLMFRQHSWESGSSWAGEGAVRALLSPEAAKLREEVTWKIFPLCDPDGVVLGGVRFNVNGYDLNRNWDVEDGVKMPEIAAQRGAVAKWIGSGRMIDFFVSLHNTETSEYLEGPPENGGKGRHAGFARRLFDLLKAKTTFAPTRDLFFSETTTTAGMKGRMTVSQGLYRDHGFATFIMEQRISMNPKLGRLPGIDDRKRFGGELVRGVWEALVSPNTTTGSDLRK
ncbi:MAG: M14-type cytosolic carboxypeptidase [Bryobacteraceae bacterium]|nr:M14-type cytosolic carboxypeptidase [Bryobacteraceae bacterium]